MVTLEAAWEPRLKIICLLHRMADVRAVDERGDPLPVADRDAQPEVPAGGEVPAVKLEIPLRLPPREVRQIARLRGKLLATVSGKTETFRFAKLGEAKNVEQRIAGVTVILEEVRKNGQAWEVRMPVAFRRCRRRLGLTPPMGLQQRGLPGRARQETDRLRHVRNHRPKQE